MNNNQTNPTIPLQRCVKCNELTGKFKDDGFDVGDGPLCESCSASRGTGR